MLRVAAARYPIGEPADFPQFAERVGCFAAAAAADGAQFLVLPEYLGLEAAAMFDAPTRADFARSLDALQSVRGDYLALARDLARRHSLHLVAGTFPEPTTNGRYRNRAWLATPDGSLAWQDKLTLTGFERSSAVLESGDVLKAFETPLGRIAILICYDIEFPLYARALTEAGVRLILVPSCTDTDAGATRVRIGCQARALENGIHVACAVTAGEADWSSALDRNTGEAAIFTPVDRGFPGDGIAARTDGERLAVAGIDLALSDRIEGQVANRADWEAQLRPLVLRARVEALGGGAQRQAAGGMTPSDAIPSATPIAAAASTSLG